MKNQFVPYKIALKLKEIGFNEKCLTKWGCTSKRLYDNFKVTSNKDDMVISGDVIAAPLWQQSFDWFREEHKLHYFINPFKRMDGFYYKYAILDICIQDNETSYEEAREACLLKLIELIEIKLEQ